ncbi:MAG: tyrosine-type recombinase/integrase [Clostridia bacterium]|nr:tyrosine-type recombinase/integrase [Clostridia bacterium]
MGNQSYFNERSEKTTNKIREIISDMPDFVYDFFVGVENNTSPLTRLNYAYDLRIFFKFLMEETSLFRDKKTIFDFEIEDFEKIKTSHIERFLSFISHYEDEDGKKKSNGERGKARKLSTLRSFFKYFYRKDILSKDVASKVQTPKIHDKGIIRLESDEVRKFLNEAETGFDLEGNAKGYHKHTSIRDTAMLTLMLGTGIRVSECVGLNLDDIDFKVNGISITRKGGNQVVLYFSDEVKVALIDWLEERERNPKIPASEQALFVSLQNRRITVRAVQNLVKKYAKLTTPLKKITPHKLRSTYGTALYRETQDIYIVADVLGHRDVNTTKKHYAAISDDIRRAAASKVKLKQE